MGRRGRRAGAGIPRVQARAPFVGDERGRDIVVLPLWIPDRHTSFLRRQESTAPFVLDERGANGVRGVCRGWMWRGWWLEEGVGICGGAPLRRPPGIPRVLASLARAPFAGSERGRGGLLRSPALDSCLRRNDGGGGGDGGGLVLVVVGGGGVDEVADVGH